MRDRDAEDDELLDAGRHAELLAAYYPVILERLRLRLPRDEAYEVGHRVVERLLRELDRGRRYTVPYRVVVHNVVTWTLRGHFGGRTHDPLPPDLPGGEDAAAGVDERVGLQQMLAALPGREREVLEMRYLDGREIEDIAADLGITRNAVDQALFRGRRRLRELLHA
jgi:RNA polymerase sigma factor (sigma-70 family)